MSEKISRYLDTAVLKPEMTRKEAIEAITLSAKYDSKTVCVRPCDIDIASKICDGTNTEVSVVLGFPHGCGLSEVKGLEAEEYIKRGVSEIDMVANYGFIRSGEWGLVESDIRSVVQVCKPASVALKVIIESSELSLEEVEQATEAAIRAGADFVKTSTGFASGVATEEVVAKMLETSAGRIKVKPSGGIRDYNRAKMFVDMGVHRLGISFSSVVAICDGGEAVTGAGY
jgi:deoxyribose-phosphate aldolase